MEIMRCTAAQLFYWLLPNTPNTNSATVETIKLNHKTVICFIQLVFYSQWKVQLVGGFEGGFVGGFVGRFVGGFEGGFVGGFDD